MRSVGELQDTGLWVPVEHQGGIIPPPMWAPQPCRAVALYIRRQAVLDNTQFHVVDLCYPNGEPVGKDDRLLCPTCQNDIIPDVQRVVSMILYPDT